jgi:hypothetical protein
MNVEPPLRQPLLPRVRLIWLFGILTAAAVLFALVRDIGMAHALVAALLVVGCSLGLLLAASALCFAITYACGSLERGVNPPRVLPQSPFAADSLPQQLATPDRRETR